jgi:hypothetical protein
MKHLVSKIASPGIKKAYRLLRYSNERKRFGREFAIRKEQDENLRLHYQPTAEKLIVFVVPGSDPATGIDNISGGTMSIVSICEETAALKNIHGAQTIMCTLNDQSLLVRHTKFENNTLVYRFEQLHDYFKSTEEVLIHLPEFMADFFIGNLTGDDKNWLMSCDSVHINVMNQNIRLMSDRAVIEQLKMVGSEVTITTAHQRYCTAQYRKDFGVPLHKLSVWISPEQYQFKEWKDKKDLIVVSPDAHPAKDAILQELSSISGLQVQIIKDLTYEEYKALIADAKWSLTFGEGLDGYFIEPVFSGAISFAIYNEQFFTADFESLNTVYPGIEELRANIRNDIGRLNNDDEFGRYQEEQFRLCAFYYSKEVYRNNIAAFYRKEFTHA